MKKIVFFPIIILLAFVVFMVMRGSAQDVKTQCPAGTLVIQRQDSSPVSLTLNGPGTCDRFSYAADLTAKNVSGRAIRSFMVATIQDYEHKKGVHSTSSQSGGVVFEIDQEKVIKFGGGFSHGYSYGKPVGSLHRIQFQVARIEFADGEVWQACPSVRIEPPEQTEYDNWTLRAVVEGADTTKFSYDWTVIIGHGKGPVISGQGTDTITITRPDNYYQKGVTVVVDIRGVPEGCVHNRATWSIIS